MRLDFDEERIKKMKAVPSLNPFSEQAVIFLNELSSQIFKIRSARSYSDVITFAYWCRRAAVLSYQKDYYDMNERLGRGLVFHIAPSNVPVNFAFSLAAGILAGCKNVVRLSGKDFPQVDLICDAMEKALENYPDMKNYVYPVRYDKSSDCTDVLSQYCNIRVIWGGDDTIREIRGSELSARAFDITFADRFSFCVIQSDDYIKMEDKKAVASAFYNDTYFSDQNACTSPHIVFWTGSSVENAKALFWEELQKLVDKKYELQAVQAVGKLDAFCMAAIQTKCQIYKSQKKNNLIRIELSELDKKVMKCHYHSGFFFEYELNDLAEITVFCDEKCQTISYLGDLREKLQDVVERAGVDGVDRIVPIGRTMEFSLIWDGYDLIRAMSRRISYAD